MPTCIILSLRFFYLLQAFKEDVSCQTSWHEINGAIPCYMADLHANAFV